MSVTRLAGLPPASNTGAEIPGAEGFVGCDWFEVTVFGVTPQIVMELLVDPIYGWDERDRGWMGYTRVFDGAPGVSVLSDPVGRGVEARAGEVHVQMTGKAAARLSDERLQLLAQWVLGHGGHASRIDLQATLPEATVTPLDFEQAVGRGEHVTQARAATSTRGIDISQRGGAGRGGDVGGTLRGGAFAPVRGAGVRMGHTFLLGSKHSRRRLRVYDKTAESDGEIEGTRIELQERDEAANTVLTQLAAGTPVAELFVGRLVNFVDFRIRDGGNVSRARRAEWFELLVGGAMRLPAYLPEDERTVEQVEAWVARAVGPMLAVLESLGMDDWDRWVEEGRDRWGPRHHGLMRAHLEVA